MAVTSQGGKVVFANINKNFLFRFRRNKKSYKETKAVMMVHLVDIYLMFIK